MQMSVPYEYNQDNRNEFMNTIKVSHNHNFHSVSILFHSRKYTPPYSDTKLGYNCPKSEQRLTVKESVKHHDVLLRLGAAIQGKSNNLTLP